MMSGGNPTIAMSLLNFFAMTIVLIEESGLRRGRRDIWIRDVHSDTEVVVELKPNLSSANEVRRLIGQIASYSEDAKAIFVVLIEPDGNMADELEINLGALQCRDRVQVAYIEAHMTTRMMSPSRTMTTLIMTNDQKDALIQPVLVRALPNYRVYLEFSDGTKGTVDLSNLQGKGVFEIWKDYAVFEKVRIGDHRQIKWNDKVELCADSLYLKLMESFY
jgi:hypothetical protein